VVLAIPVKISEMKHIIYFVIIVWAILFSACSGPKKSVQNNSPSGEKVVKVQDEKTKEFEYLFIEALKQKMIGNAQKAVSYLSACLEIDPNSSAAMYELANLHFLNKDLTSASLLLEKAIALHPENKWYNLMLARIYQQSGKDTEAAALYDKLSKIEPENQEYLYIKALELAKAKKYDESIRTLNDLEKKTGLNDQVSMARQEVYLEAGKTKEAFAEIEKLISANPGDSRYVGLLADLYKEQGDKVNALKYYKKIMVMDPENGFVNFSLANYYYDEGDTTEAYKYVKKGFESENLELETKLQFYLLHTDEAATYRFPDDKIGELMKIIIEKHRDDNRVYPVYAEYLIHNKRNHEAREQLLKAVENGINDYAIWEQILYLDNDLQEWQALYDHGTAALKLFPNQAQLYFLNAIAALQLDKYKETMDIADEGLNYVVDNDQLKGQFIFIKGEALYKIKNLEEAFGLFDKAIALDSENYIALNNYAYYLSLADRDLEKAERMSSKVIEKFPENATYLDTYAWVLFKKNEYTLAKFYMKTALDKSEVENPTLIEHYGDILFMLGNVDEALTLWKKALDLGAGSSLLKQKIAEKKYIRENK
jgi:tetratricopeptide (TPR) repeat protein